MKKIYGFGIIGCGVISKWHADSILNIENAKLVGGFDMNKAGAEKFAAEYNCRVFSDMEEMFTCPDVDVVCICTPSGTHAPIAIDAANHKKNVIVEKPVAITRDQLEALVAAVEENGVKLAVISQLRFNETILKVKKAIDEGKIGRILTADISMKYYRSPEYYATSGWRGTWAMDGGGALMNQGIHGIDILQFLAGKVKSVSGIAKTLNRDIEVEDAACAVLEYENGAIGYIQGTTCVTPGYPRHLEISGTLGTIALEEDTIVKWDIEGEESISGEITHVGSSRDPGAFDAENHRKQIADLIAAIEEDRAPKVDIYEGKRPVEIILGIYESSKCGHKVNI